MFSPQLLFKQFFVGFLMIEQHDPRLQYRQRNSESETTSPKSAPIVRIELGASDMSHSEREDEVGAHDGDDVMGDERVSDKDDSEDKGLTDGPAENGDIDDEDIHSDSGTAPQTVSGDYSHGIVFSKRRLL